MSKMETKLNSSDFRSVLSRLENGIPNSSISAGLEDGSNFEAEDARCAVRVFKRHSLMSRSRVSMTVTLFQRGDDPVYLSAITYGGERTLLNFVGEDAFLDVLRKLLERELLA